MASEDEEEEEGEDDDDDDDDVYTHMHTYRYGNVRRPSGGRAWGGPPPRATTGGPPASLIQQLPTYQFLNGLVSGAQPEAWARPVDPPGSLFGHSAPALPMKRAGRGIMPETRISGGRSEEG